MTRYNLNIANNLDHNPNTHIDLKTKKAKALDLVISNINEDIQNFTIDHNQDFSPFSIRKTPTERKKIYSDHSAICFDLSIGCNVRNLKSINKPKSWMYNSVDGKMKYEILTNEAFDWLIEVITEVDDINDVIPELTNSSINASIKVLKFVHFPGRSMKTSSWRMCGKPGSGSWRGYRRN